MNTGFKNDMRFSITNCLIALYVIVFIASAIYGADFARFRFGLNTPAVVQGHQYWRIVTSSFMHADIIHLLMNSYFIFVIGNGVEAMLGKWRYLILVIVSTLTSSAVIVLWDLQTHASTITIGASGFGFGLLGLLGGFSIMYPKRYYGKYLRDLFINIGVYALLFMMLGLNVSWSGHIGGFLGGLIMALIFNTFFPKKEW